MTYRLPQFAFLHAAKETGVGNITLNNDYEDADFPIAHLIDNRPSSLMKFSQSASDHWIKIDRGSGSLEAIDRLIIPEGHNLDPATTITIETNSTDEWPGTTRGTLVTPGSGLLDITLTSNTDRWIYVEIFGTGTWEIGQLFFTRTRTMTTAGPDSKWTERPVPAMIRRELSTREANSTLAANRKAWSLTHNALDSTDVAILDDLLEAVGVGASPFYYDSTDDGDDPRLMRIENLAPTRQQDNPAPKSNDPTYEIALEMLEQTS